MFGRWRTQRSERIQKWPRDCNYCRFPLALWSFARILAENLTLCRVADTSACNLQKHSPENLDDNNLLAFERFVPSSLQVVPRFRSGYFRDCSGPPPELMYSQETDVSSEIVLWSLSASSIPVHRQSHRYELTQPQCDSSVWIHLKFSHSSCAALRVTRLHQETLLRSCRMLGEKEVLMMCLFGGGCVVCTSRARSPAKQCFEMFPTNR